MLRRRSSVSQALITEVMYVLNESLDLFPCVTFSNCFSNLTGALYAVSHKGLPQDGDERAVAGQEDAICRSARVHVAVRNVEANECLPGAGDSGDEANRLSSVGA